MVDKLKRTIKFWIKKVLARFGLQLVRLPRLEANQAGFEEILARYLTLNDPANFYFIQVGAYDGVTNDPLCAFIRTHHLRGLLVEPQKGPFLALQENYRDQPQLKFLNAAISGQDGVRNFYTVRNDVDGLPGWSQQIGSFNLEHLLKHKNGVPDYGITEGIPNIEELVQVQEVETLCFDTLMNKADSRKIDLLQIDAEGYDYELIKLINFKHLKPRILHYEHMHLSESDRRDCEQYLKDKGYKINNGFADTIAFSF
jgi:FkbM family methyltransferase